MESDRAVEAFKHAARRAVNEDDRIDFKALYPATVVKQEGDEVSVIFDDRERLGYKSGIKIRPPLPGQTIKIAAQTRVLVGWYADDESNPHVVGIWLEQGGLVDLTHVYSGTYKLDGPHYVGKHSSEATFETPEVHVKNELSNTLVHVEGDVKYEHDIGRGIPPIGTTLSNDVVSVVALGSYHMFIVNFTVKNLLPANSPIFQVQFAVDPMPGTIPMAYGNACNLLGLFGFPLGILATQALLTVFVGGCVPTPPGGVPPGNYTATIHTSSYTPV